MNVTHTQSPHLLDIKTHSPHLFMNVTHTHSPHLLDIKTAFLYGDLHGEVLCIPYAHVCHEVGFFIKA
eukprot:c901_g1_i1 orf=108-311(-)